jgi:hypothetical protein
MAARLAEEGALHFAAYAGLVVVGVKIFGF